MEHSFFGPLFRRVLGLTIALSPLLLLLLALTPAAPAQASGTTITNCSNDTDLQSTVVLTGGLITFNCGGTHAPAVIPLSGVLAPISGTIINGSNGGHPVVLDGQGLTRLIEVEVDRVVTVTNLTLMHGTDINGSCVVVYGGLELDAVEAHDCLAGAGNFGGALYVDSGATATLINDNLHNNSAGISGGGIYSPGKLIVNNSRLAHNAAGTDGGPVGDGGGIWGSGFTEVSGGTFFSNTAAIGYGGGIYNQGNLIASGVSLQDNTAGQWGGGIRNWTGSATLIQVTLSENQAVNGGGIASDGAGSYLGLQDNVSLFGNQAQTDGGGIYIDDGNPVSIPYLGEAVYDNNSASYGGGLYVSGPAFVGYSTFAGNSAVYGGAIDNAGDVDIRYTTLSRNSAGFGAGVHNSGTASLTNDTLSSNTAVYGGGFHSQAGSRATLWNVTLASNSATTSGGAAYLESGGVLTVTNTILAYSRSSGNCAGAPLASSQDSISDDVTCALSGTVHGHPANGLDPHLSVLGNYGGSTLVHMPVRNSPAIDGVSGANAPADDQRLKHRPVDGGQGNGYDIGAVERQPGDNDWAPKLWLPLLRR